MREAAPLVSALIVSVGICSMARAATPATVTIDVDATRTGPALVPVWAFYGYDEVNYTTTPDARELLRTLATSSGTAPRIRTHFLLNTGDGTPGLKWGSTNLYTEDAAGGAVYHYSLIDPIMDAMIEAGTLPLVEIGFMPQALSIRPNPYRNSNTYTLDGGCFYPPADYEKWESLVRTWAAHVRDRYPGAESSWQWELWNEPDIGYWRGSFEDYARLYDHTEAALHAVLPGASLGGPAVAHAEGDFLSRFLEHCATGTNAVTGQTGTRLDMVSFHAKGGVLIQDGHVQMDLGNQLRLHRAGFEAVASSAFARTPIVISEADPDGCAACPVSTAPQNAYRNSPAYGAYVVAMMKRTLELAEQVDVNLRGVLTWAFTFPETPYFAGYRALTTNGIHLPVLNAFKLLGRLRGARLVTTSSGALPLSDILDEGLRQRPDVDALAAMDGDRIRILVWNYHDELVEAPPTGVSVTVSVPAALGPRARLTHTRVDATHGDAFSVWQAQGSPELPSDVQLAALRESMQPAILERERAIDVEDGAVRLSFDLPRFGLSLLELTPMNASNEEAPAPSGSGCAYRADSKSQSSLHGLLPLSLAVLLARRGRLTRSEASAAARNRRPQ